MQQRCEISNRTGIADLHEDPSVLVTYETLQHEKQILKWQLEKQNGQSAHSFVMYSKRVLSVSVWL